jgi:8-oxo-dGTP pyrophosphatase MutT (NUDIX family)
MYLDFPARLRVGLDPDPRVEPAPGERLAAVLIPLLLADEPTLVFTLRSDRLSRHAGEVSFPGGMAEANDPHLRATALREAQEEIGLDPASVEIVGGLSAVHTFVSGILVVPFVGLMAEPLTLTIDDDEIARVFTATLATLGSAEEQIEHARPDGGIWVGWSYEVEGGRIWGATGQMVHDLLLVASGARP